jgi:hypothetical protein
MRGKADIHFSVEKKYYDSLARLPWDHPISEWDILNQDIVSLKRGVSRHIVIFVKSNGYEFAVKEISAHTAKKEIANYEEILKRGVHTLLPVGYVIREDDPIEIELPTGKHYEKNETSHTITLIANRVLPDSTLFARKFQDQNLYKIFDAIVELFVDLHSNNIYWGDASLANMLVRFDKVELPSGKKNTRLRALLADAETVEIFETISDSMRQADIDFFLESMEWINEDLKSEGLGYDENNLKKINCYIVDNYNTLYSRYQKLHTFEEKTGLNIKRFFSDLTKPEYIDIIDQQIEEHKWYLSEKSGEAVGIKEAADDWYQNVFSKIKEIMLTYDILVHFPDKNILDVYIEIMQHKYYLSQKLNKDVGIITTIKDYSSKYSEDETLAQKVISISKALLKIVGIE